MFNPADQLYDSVINLKFHMQLANDIKIHDSPSDLEL